MNSSRFLTRLLRLFSSRIVSIRRWDLGGLSHWVHCDGRFKAVTQRRRNGEISARFKAGVLLSSNQAFIKPRVTSAKVPPWKELVSATAHYCKMRALYDYQQGRVRLLEQLKALQGRKKHVGSVMRSRRSTKSRTSEFRVAFEIHVLRFNSINVINKAYWYYD